MKVDFDILEGMIGVREQDIDLFLYRISEEFEDQTNIRGVWTSAIFRNFWWEVALKATEVFLDRINVNEDGSFWLQVRSEKDKECIYDDKAIRRYFFCHLGEAIANQPTNTSIMELIKINNQ